MQHTDNIFWLAAPQRQAGELRGKHGAHDLFRRIVGANHHHLGAVNHDVGDFQLTQIEQAAEHVAVELFDAALAVQQVNRPAQLLVRRQDRLIFSHAYAGEYSQQPTDQSFDAHQHRTEQADHPFDRSRDRQAIPAPAH